MAPFLWLFVGFLWMSSSLKSCRCKNTDCDYTESYDEIVTVSVKEPVDIIKNKWCLDIPPRCPDNEKVYRIVQKNITVPKMRRVKRCCKDQIQLYNECVQQCTEEQCPNIECVPKTAKCKCKSGYIGHLCNQRCDVGYWGAECKTSCGRACADCDHRTGCCKKPSSRVDERAELIMCTADPRTTTTAAAAADRLLARNGTGGHGHEDRRPSTPPASAPSTVDGRAPSTETAPQRRNDGGVGGLFVGTLEVTVYKYDELVKKLVWMSAMTVAAIALVFVVMFVVFINCYGAYKPAGGGPGSRGRPPTSGDAEKTNETCITTQSLGHIPPDRYTKSPTLHTVSNGYIPIHPEVFCPVFSAPHHTDGSLLYDTPQPLYEILS